MHHEHHIIKHWAELNILQAGLTTVSFIKRARQDNLHSPSLKLWAAGIARFQAFTNSKYH